MTNASAKQLVRSKRIYERYEAIWVSHAIVPLAICGALLAPRAQAASFSCKVAVTPTEQAICRSPALSKLDEAMSKAYRRALANARVDAQRQALVDEQKGWLASRDWCDANVYGGADCLTDIYRARIETLQARSSSSGHAARRTAVAKPTYKVAWADSEHRDMCRAMTANLNSFPAWPPMVCELKHNPKFQQFRPLPWRYWSVDEFRQRWPLVNEVLSDGGASTQESAESFVARIARGEWGVAEVVLPAPPFHGHGASNGDIGSYLRAGEIPRYQLSPDALARDVDLLRGLGLKTQYEYPNKYDRQCRTSAAVPLTADGKHVWRPSGLRTYMTSPQLWLYAPPDKPAVTIEQSWRVIAPGFLWGDLVLHDEFTCVIRYFKPAATTTSESQQ